MKVAIMQPYHYPYAGYYRLFAVTDLFVIYDCCQWNRRGRVHRYHRNGKWETLPIKKTERDSTRIMDMQWNGEVEYEISPVDYICSELHDTCKILDIPFKTIRSSSLNIDPLVKGSSRILAICKKVGATEYVNSPGGRHLYDEEAFAREGVKLTFLPFWEGSYDSIIEQLSHKTPENIRGEIYAQI